MFGSIHHARKILGAFNNPFASPTGLTSSSLKIVNPTNLDEETKGFLSASGEPLHPPRASRFSILGCDLGQSVDHAAACELSKSIAPGDLVGPNNERLYCTYLRQWPKGYDYTVLADDLLDLNPNVITPEFNSVGRPFVDILRRRARVKGYQGRIIPVVTASSNAKLEEHREARGKHLTVPKQDIVTSIVAAQQRDLLRFHRCGKGCPKTCSCDVNKLLKELQNFQYRISKAMNTQYGNIPGGGRHDDMVISLGLACFMHSRVGYKKDVAISFGGR